MSQLRQGPPEGGPRVSRRLRISARPRIFALTVALVIALAALTQAQAPRTVQDRIFTDAQAARGQALYAKSCAGCHGSTLGGAQAPPLAGEAFVARWRTEPLSGLFIKIRYTMPPQPAPAGTPSLAPEQAVDLVAHILKTNAFPAGQTDLPAADMETSAIRWPAVQPADAARAASAPRTYPLAGNVAQLMRGVFFPSSNLIFTVQTRDPGAPLPPPPPSAQGVGTSVFEWGMGIYTGWPVVENAAVAIADNSPLMLAPGLRCENGQLAPVNDPDWIRFTEDMMAVARRTLRLAQTKNQEAVSEITGDLSDSCAACHQAYRDVGRGRGAAPGAAGGGRCASRVR